MLQSVLIVDVKAVRWQWFCSVFPSLNLFVIKERRHTPEEEASCKKFKGMLISLF